MKTGLHLLLFLLMSSGTGLLFAQGDRCNSIQPFCAGDELLVFENSNYLNSTVTTAEPGPYYGCLVSQPYPAWFYLQVREAGDLEFLIRQTQNADGSGTLYDVDFIAYGPFTVEDDYCSNESLSASNVVDCSFLPAAAEEMIIPSAKVDEIYVVLITNYREEPGFISLSQTNSTAGGSASPAGSTDCSIVGNILGDDRKVCGDTSFLLDATNPRATNYIWNLFDEATGNFEIVPGETGPTLNVSESGNYQVTVINTILGAEVTDDVIIEFFELPEANEPSAVTGCSQDDYIVFDLLETSIELIGSNTGNFSTRYYISQENFENGEFLPAGPVFFDLDENLNLFGTVVNEDTGCESLPKELDLEVFSMPELEMPAVTALCLDLGANVINTVFLGEDFGPGYTYSWNVPNDPTGDGVEDPVLELNAYPSSNPINLTITHTASGCTSFYTTDVKVFSPPLEVEIEIEGNDFEGGYQLTATAVAGFGDETSYEYRLNDGEWQVEPVFRGVPAGTYSVEAREVNGCGIATSGQFRLFGYSRFFTPNNDGYNDTWNIVNNTTGAVDKILIFDRYGKLLKQLEPTGAGWDGNFNGRLMPADDYWFSIEYRDETGNSRVFKGHFSLVR